MNGKYKIYLSDHTSDWGEKFTDELAELGHETTLFPANGKVLLQAIRKECPDVVLVGPFLSYLDTIEVMRECHSLPHSPKFIVLSVYQTTTLEHQLFENGVDYYMLLPVEADELSRKIEELCRPKSKSLEVQITEILHTIGVPVKIKGYHYLRESILLSIADEEVTHAVTKQLYPDIAKKHKTTTSRVERAIRHAIEVTWNEDNTERLNQYFGYVAHTSRGKPTNSEFIAMITDKIRLGMR